MPLWIFVSANVQAPRTGESGKRGWPHKYSLHNNYINRLTPAKLRSVHRYERYRSIVKQVVVKSTNPSAFQCQTSPNTFGVFLGLEVTLDDSILSHKLDTAVLFFFAPGLYFDQSIPLTLFCLPSEIWSQEICLGGFLKLGDRFANFPLFL